MRIAKIEDLHCNAGWRDFSFLKITTDDGLVGWSEFMENFGAEGLSGVIQRLGERLIGMDPRPVREDHRVPARPDPADARTASISRRSRRSRTRSSISRQSRSAFPCTSCWAVRCATGCGSIGRIAAPGASASPTGSRNGPATSRSARWTTWSAPGAEVAARGFKGLKTNIMRFDVDPPVIHMPGFNGAGWPELNIDRPLIDAMRAELSRVPRRRRPGVGLHLDLNFNFKTEGYIRLAQALEEFDLVWLEIDSYDPEALATIRRSRPYPVASLRVAVWSAAVPALPGAAGGRRRDHRRRLERHSGVLQDRRHGRRVRGERRAA